MGEKTLNSRIQLKHDTQTNWNKATSFIPKAGEVIIYDVDANYNYPRMKIGDGTTAVTSLPFLSNDEIISTKIANALGTLDAADPSQNGTSTSFIKTITQSDGLIKATKASLPTANKSTAGVVQGSSSDSGDVTIANGIISVKDNSHKHTTDNITDFQIALNTRATPADITTAIAALDYDGATASGNSISFITQVTQADGLVSASKASVPIATSTQVGLVKSGTDITVDDNGNVSVNDNSHSHISANISDLNTTISSAISTAIAALDASDPTANGNSTTFIKTISQTNGTITATKASIPTADGTTLGMVKQGGDVTIVKGEITVKDNSHKHIMSNVDGLEEALETKATPADITTAIGALEFTEPTANGNSTSFIATLSQTDGVVTATKKTVPTADGTALGLVKGGGDVTIVKGEIRVNDNSHSHTSSNISDLNNTINSAITTAIGTLDASDPAASGTATSFITSISQKDGIITATKANITAAALGLSGAMRFLGTSATKITDGVTTNPITIGSTSTTVASGNVVLYGSKEFVWTGSKWEELGNEGSYKVQQTAVNSPTTNGTAIEFIDTISQNAQGVISATKKRVASASTSAAGLLSAEDKAKLDGITASADAVSFTRNATSGNKIGTITINETSLDLYSPTQTSVSGNAGTSTTLKTARAIDGVNFDGSAAITHYGTCSTTASTVAKAVSLANFTLVTGARIAVKFTVTNTAASPTLNVNNTGAKAIMYRGAAISKGYLEAKRVYEFVYDGTNWELIGDINTDTNTKVTSATNHYTPAEDTSAALSADASSTTAATWNSTSLVTGVNLARDAKGHVVGVTVDSIKMPANPNSNTTYTLSGKASGSTWVTTLTPSSGTATTSTVPAATQSAAGLMTKDDKFKLDNTNVAYGTCDTAAATAAKVVALSGNTQWKLTNGAIIMVKFTNSNSASSVTLNVNSTGAYPIWYSNAEYTGAGTAYTGYAGRTITYMFNGTHWVWISGSYDANTQSNTNSTDTSDKIFLIGATSQGSSKTTYSHGEVYVGTNHHVYSNSKQVVNLSDTQALTNKTYNGYTLGAACAKGVATSVASGNTSLVTSGAVYTALGSYLPLSGGTMTGDITMGYKKISLGSKTVLDGSSEQLTCSIACFVPSGWAFFSIKSADQTLVRSSWQINDSNQLFFRSYRTTDTSNYEAYYLPAPAATGTSNATYNILTSKGGATSGLLYSSSNVALTSSGFRNIKVVTPGTTVTAGSTAIPTGEIWLRYEE